MTKPLLMIMVHHLDRAITQIHFLRQCKTGWLTGAGLNKQPNSDE
jgi:hypothetical protein